MEEVRVFCWQFNPASGSEVKLPVNNSPWTARQPPSTVSIAPIFSCNLWLHHLSHRSRHRGLQHSPGSSSIRHSKVGSCGTVSRRMTAQLSLPCTQNTLLCFCFINSSFRKKKKGWQRSQEGSDLSPTVSLMAEKPLAASGGGKTQ